ncbi:MAG TPA: hypothetical protein EYP14_19635 [Planctomycetaceae bacterium]|nr:hypothetical protein [Planctomycetaceae bacterium]
MLDAVEHRPLVRVAAIEVLKKIHCYEAIDPLAVLAVQTDPAVYGPALDGLRGIADPDRHDLPRLLALVPKAAPGRHRDEVEKTIQVVCEKLPPGTDRAEPVLQALKASEGPVPAIYLPLLGRLGGPKALAIVEAASRSEDPATRRAAAIALCNWPTADVADKLLALATRAPDKALGRRALRAYIRVVSRKSGRPEKETLAMLQRAFRLATVPEDKRLVLRRAAAVRTMESVEWLASFLDDPELAPAACESIVELAHHRFLRQPNIDRFRPILEKVIRTSQDPVVIERAKRAKLGL